MDTEGWVAVIALVVSLLSFAWTILAHRHLVRHASVHANMAALIELYNRAESPSILRFHGVSQEELDAAGLTAKEFAYLVASFEAASVYYRFHETSPTPFKPSSLRYRLLATPETRRAWPLLSRFFESDSTFMRKIEETLKLFDSSGEPPRAASTSPNLRQTERSIGQSPANPAAPADQKASLPGR
jgi:hypothetical protein